MVPQQGSDAARIEEESEVGIAAKEIPAHSKEHVAISTYEGLLMKEYAVSTDSRILKLMSLWHQRNIRHCLRHTKGTVKPAVTDCYGTLFAVELPVHPLNQSN